MNNSLEQSIKIEKLQAENARLQAKLDELTAKHEWLLSKYLLQIKKVFGRSREQIDGQIVIEGIFNDAEAEADTSKQDPDVETVTEPIATIIKKYSGQRKEKLEGLPVERIEYECPEEERVCNNCGEPLPELKPEIRRRIDVIPAQVKVVEEVRHIYAGCKKCDKDDGSKIIKAQMPEAAIPHSVASEATVAYVITGKYQYGMPLYRQETQWRMADLNISRQTMANWVILAADNWLRLIYDRMHSLLIQRDIVMADESSFQVLHEKGRTAQQKSYMWLYRSGRDGPPIILFEYQQTRQATHPEKFLSGFIGYLCTDGYSGYYSLPDIINVSCFSHARRYFYDAFMSIPKDARKKTAASFIGLDYCDKLFDVEREAADMTPEERFEHRMKKSRPILDDFKHWLDLMKPDVSEKSNLGKAVNYCLKYWITLCNFMLDGRLYIDNNASERNIRGYVSGRKAWLFANTSNGATASAILYSLVLTAYANNLKPFEYIHFLLKSMPNSNVKDQAVLDSYLPWSESIPDECKLKK